MAALSGRIGGALTLLAGALAMTLVLAGSAQAVMKVKAGSFTADSLTIEGTADTRAGAHPYQATTNFDLDLASSGEVSGSPRDIHVSLPPGFAGDPEAAAKCPREAIFVMANRNDSKAECPADSQVGNAIVRIQFTPEFVVPLEVPVFNLIPPDGVVAQFGMVVQSVPVFLSASVDTAGEYGLVIDSKRTSQSLPIVGVTTTFWGVPNDPSHDAERTCGAQFPSGPCPVDAPRKPLLTNPSSCSSPLVSTLSVDSWRDPGLTESVSYESAPVAGCDRLRFVPKFSAAVEAASAGAPTALSVRLTLPQRDDPNTGLATPPLRDVRVTLPEGMRINPVSADGLAGCTDQQLGLHSNSPVGCPAAAKIGTITATTPVLSEPLAGSVVLRSQASSDPESGQMYRLAIVLESAARGLLVKLPGEARVSRDTGRVTAVFADNPQLPVETIELSLKGGPRAPLTMPPTCGPQTIVAQLSSWAGQSVDLSDSFEVPGPGCQPSQLSLGLEAGASNPIAGSFSPFLMRLTRGDRQESLSSLEVVLPPGEVARLAGVSVCGDAQAAAASCPVQSQVGTATVGVGAGSNPLYVPQPGKAPTAVYLAGPYRSAPYSLVVKVPAQAGPFDLGDVVVRNALYVDPESAQVSAKSDPLPQMVAGVPVAYRDIRVDIDRPDFTLNPTSCDELEVEATVESTQAKKARATSGFQVANCERLAFKPTLKLKLSGAPTRRGGYPALRAELTMPKGGANIEKAQVTLPKTEFLENAHIRTICTRVQYAANGGGGKACPPASVYGYAKAWTPLLDKPLEGPVYLRSSSHKLPDLVASLDGQIHVDLVGKIDAKNARIRNTFESVPDATVSKFVLTMQGGKKGLLVNNTDICKTKPIANASFDGQNGKASDSSPQVKVPCRRASATNRYAGAHPPRFLVRRRS